LQTEYSESETQYPEKEIIISNANDDKLMIEHVKSTEQQYPHAQPYSILEPSAVISRRYSFLMK
jgi:hypothetical protein